MSLNGQSCLAALDIFQMIRLIEKSNGQDFISINYLKQFALYKTINIDPVRMETGEVPQ